MADYKVQLNVFEGPLDLLLYLIKKEEVDIYEVNLTKIATQFIEHVELMRRLDLDIAGEFLVMAATLMYIKSRELLPVDQQVKVEEEEDAIDPRWDLIRQLVEYKKFKDMAAQLQNREAQMDAVYGRQPGKVEFPEPEAEVGKGVSLFDLIQAVSTILKRFQETEKPGTISEDKWSVSEKIQLLDEMIQTRSVVRFSELFAAAHSRAEVIVTFLAMLELTRMKKAWLSQPEVFGEIEVSAAPPEAALPGGPIEPPEAETAALPRQQIEGADEELDEAELLAAQAKAKAIADSATATPAEPVNEEQPDAPTTEGAEAELEDEPSEQATEENLEPTAGETEAGAESAEATEDSEEAAAADEDDADEYDDDEDEFDEDELDEEASAEGEADEDDEETEGATEIETETEAPAAEADSEALAAGNVTPAAEDKPGTTAANRSEPPAAAPPADPEPAT